MNELREMILQYNNPALTNILNSVEMELNHRFELLEKTVAQHEQTIYQTQQDLHILQQHNENHEQIIHRLKIENKMQFMMICLYSLDTAWFIRENITNLSAKTVLANFRETRHELFHLIRKHDTYNQKRYITSRIVDYLHENQKHVPIFESRYDCEGVFQSMLHYIKIRELNSIHPCCVPNKEMCDFRLKCLA
uniref:Uncharacterized protein n=1 Tax=viral metagenome TaxID=1070528 RepID=A0A6C0CQD8_9ZZZZ